VTDDNNVYVLGNTTFMSKVASNMEDWVVVPAPAGAVSILSTSSNVWAQDAAGKKWKLAKPGTTGNWISVEDPSGTIMTSASGTSLYGIQGGKAVKSDESLQSGWSPLGEFEGTMSKIFGDLDKTALYGVDMTNSLSRCESGTCKPVDIPAPVQNMTIDPKGSLWLTTTTQGLKGNVYTKTDSLKIPDTTELDRQRDEVVHQIQLDKKSSSMKKTADEIMKYLKGLFQAPDPQQEQQVIQNSDFLDQMQKIIPALTRILMYIGAVTIVYIFIDGYIAHLISTVILGVGVYDVYLSGKQ
jgi:hypothetical protein